MNELPDEVSEELNKWRIADPPKDWDDVVRRAELPVGPRKNHRKRRTLIFAATAAAATVAVTVPAFGGALFGFRPWHNTDPLVSASATVTTSSGEEIVEFEFRATARVMVVQTAKGKRVLRVLRPNQNPRRLLYWEWRSRFLADPEGLRVILTAGRSSVTLCSPCERSQVGRFIGNKFANALVSGHATVTVEGATTGRGVIKVDRP